MTIHVRSGNRRGPQEEARSRRRETERRSPRSAGLLAILLVVLAAAPVVADTTGLSLGVVTDPQGADVARAVRPRTVRTSRRGTTLLSPTVGTFSRTPDVAAVYPRVATGSQRVVQFAVKLLF